jgi:hypothetical protein
MPFICFAVNSPHETLLIFSARYPADMGPLRHRVMKNTGIRSEPILETRVKEYTEFVSRDGIIGNSERVIVGVRRNNCLSTRGAREEMHPAKYKLQNRRCNRDRRFANKSHE